MVHVGEVTKTMSKERRARFSKIAKDSAAVGNLQQSTDATPFNKKKVIKFMKADSKAFARKITCVLKGSLEYQESAPYKRCSKDSVAFC